jgi:6-phosphogluconolactonase
VILTRVFADAEDLAARASQIIAEALGAVLRERDRAIVVLAGGTTPQAAYERLAERLSGGSLRLDRIDWLLGDERWVPVADPDSNEGMARRTLLEPIGAPELTLHSWRPVEGDPADCAARFAVRLASGRFAAGPDLAILGIGADGHTASLFAGATALLPGGREAPVDPDLPVDAAAIRRAEGGLPRLTLTPKWLRMARCVAFLAAGGGKREALARTLRGDRAAPAAWVRGTADTLFLVDREAAGPGPDATGRDVRYA